MCSKSDLNKILEEVAKIYKGTFQGRIRAMYLYGSCARGTNTDTSDIDIVAIVDGDRIELQQELKFVWEKVADISLEYDTIVSPTVIPYEEFENYKDILPYYKNIVKEGVKISA